MKAAMGPPPPRNPNLTSSNTNPSVDSQMNVQNEPSNSATTKVPMGSPPPRNPNPISSNTNASVDTQMSAQNEPSNSATMKVPMGSPPPRNPNPLENDTNPSVETHMNAPQEHQANHSNTHVAEPVEKASENPNPKPTTNSTSEQSQYIAVPYKIPPWSQPPCHPFSLEVLKDGSIVDQFNVSEKGAYMFGRVDLCDFVLDHPTISRFHAVLQFKENGDAYLYDLGSTHGTFVNKNQVKKNVYTELHVGNVIRFGHSSRLYIFQGPSELMPPERDLKNIRNAKIREDMQDCEASLSRARLEASLADGISWGMAEDAIEEVEDEADEVTWQTYKGQLTERQEKTRDKVIKRTEKIANMKKEIDAIRAKDIAQGGLTQGQQTQIARNEQRISQIMEELESLEETLNESIQESIGARIGKVLPGKKKGAVEDEDEVISDDDEFYDRTKKKPVIQKTGECQSIETADTLLDKKDSIINEMEDKKLLFNEKSRMVPEIEGATEGGDTLDAYMTGLSSQLVLNTTAQLQEELSILQSELDRILYLLKIADPTGEAARKRESKVQATTSNKPELSTSAITKQLTMEQKKCSVSERAANDPTLKVGTPDATTQVNKLPESEKVTEAIESKISTYTVTKPKWLGAIEEMKIKDTPQQEAPSDMNESGQFVDYKDRKKALGQVDAAPVNMESGIEGAAPGLIIRKRKQVEKPGGGDDKAPEQSISSSAEAESTAADAVALLLKHERGYFASDEEGINESQGIRGVSQSRQENTKSRRVLGPERPSFLNRSPDYDSWVPPKGQSGDGRTSLNERYGY